MNVVHLLLLVLALACFLLAAFNTASKVNLIALGLAFWIMGLILPPAL